MNVNKKSCYERYRKSHSNKAPTCPVCGKDIYSYDLDEVEYIKTKRGTDIFVHTRCVKKWGN